MTTSPDGSLVTVDERLAEIVERYGAESAKARFVALAGRELRTATQRVSQRLAASRRTADVDRGVLETAGGLSATSRQLLPEELVIP
jgi:hypothetical protein